jgi:hypothetical protein
VTRPGRTNRGQALPGLFAHDPLEAVLQVLRRQSTPLTAAGVKKELLAGGVPRVDVDRTWPRVQRLLVSHDHVTVENHRYAWTAQPRVDSAAQALELLAGGRVPAGRRAQLVAAIRAALAGPPVDLEDRARQRQAQIDAVRALAELAGEVEELAVNETRTEALVHRVRARVKRSGLEPVDRAGDETTYDRARHKPISGTIRDGAPVLVVRPGYIWKAPTEDLLVSRSIVEE